MTFLYWSAVPVLGLGLLVYSYNRKKRYLDTPVPLTVTAWQHYGDRYTCVTLARADGGTLPDWTPGSHIVVNVAGAKGTHRRAYSLMDGDRHTVEIAIARQPHGKVSGHILDNLHQGQVMYAQPPRGRFFRLETSRHDRVCFIGGGVGIAPLIAMAKAALAQGRVVTLLHAARYARELVKYDALAQLATQHQHFTYIPVVSRDMQPDVTCMAGRIDVALLVRYGVQQFEGDVYICGSSAFVDAQVANVKQLGCSGTVFQESFTGNASPLPHEIRVGDKRFAQGYAPTLLAACEENGINQFAECRTGHCLNCRVKVSSGQVTWLVKPGQGMALPPDTILTCACVPASDIVLDMTGKA